jgi:putative ABC transport system substrate-binding protein
MLRPNTIGCNRKGNARERLAALAAHYRIPAIYALGEYAAAGGLISRGAGIAGAYRQAGTCTGQIHKCDKPAYLAVVWPINFQLVINLKAAKILGLGIPPSPLAGLKMRRCTD